MKLDFIKMHGLGNDYIYFDCLDEKTLNPHEPNLFWLCDRNKGIGGDGIVLILPSQIAHGRMQMFNIDGSEGAMCGNAIRCVAEYLYTNVHAPEQMKIETFSGIKHITKAPTGWRVDMGKAGLFPAEPPIIINDISYEYTRICMGNPHAVIFMDDIDTLDLPAIGPTFEHHPNFAPDRINTEFIKVISRNHLKMRVWERGSGETQACGTGACAAVVAAVLNGHCDKGADITVDLPGGSLVINYTDEAVFMTGKATKVFEGTIL